MDRKHPRFRLNRRRIRRRRDREVDIASAQFLQYLRLLAQLRARELIDDQRAVAQLLELLAKVSAAIPYAVVCGWS
jgi:hypothetical protein